MSCPATSDADTQATWPIWVKCAPDLLSVARVLGRVENGRGSLGPMASTPFPILAHRTGLAELPHPALRLASPPGPRRDTSRQAFEAQHPALPMQYCEGELVVAAPCHFVPSNEERAHALANIVINAAES
jgi:hypothetical protein